MHRIAGLIYGHDIHHLDHIAPLCLLMQMPLLITEEKIAEKARTFYPGLEVIKADYLAIAEFLVTHYDVIFYSIPRDLFDEIFFFAQKLLQKKVHTVWCPHGNSDKGSSTFYMEALKKEEVALVYGKQMIDVLQKKGVYDQLKAHVIVGNYRYALYQQHLEFYNSSVEREILRRLVPKKKKILYAPTWQDYERSTSFFDAMPHLAEHIPAEFILLVKLHPNLLRDPQAEEIMDEYRSHEQILFIPDFPPIYPLLSVIDIYLGDMSSIGYDFLTFDRPMFFLKQQDTDLYLFRCGTAISKDNYASIYTIIQEHLQFELRSFSPIRKEVYQYTFGHSRPLAQVRAEILQALAHFPEKDLSFF